MCHVERRAKKLFRERLPYQKRNYPLLDSFSRQVWAFPLHPSPSTSLSSRRPWTAPWQRMRGCSMTSHSCKPSSWRSAETARAGSAAGPSGRPRRGTAVDDAGSNPRFGSQKRRGGRPVGGVGAGNLPRSRGCGDWSGRRDGGKLRKSCG